MALGFILFSMFMLFIIIITTIAVIILLKGGKFIIKNKDVKNKNKIKFIISIIGVFIGGIIIIIIFINIIIIFILPIKTTNILFKTNNGIKEIENIARIEQSIDNFGIIANFNYLKEYHEKLPSRYNLKFYIISDNIKEIIINSIYLIANEERQDILNDEEKGFIINYSRTISYHLNFDYKALEYITIIYNIDIILKNEEKINIEEKSEYKKEIIIE